MYLDTFLQKKKHKDFSELYGNIAVKKYNKKTWLHHEFTCSALGYTGVTLVFTSDVGHMLLFKGMVSKHIVPEAPSLRSNLNLSKHFFFFFY